MKVSFLLILLFLAGCAVKQPPVVQVVYRPGNLLPVHRNGSVRQAERIKAYPLGRYIDPHNPRLMHEGHTVYRVETAAKWNLYPAPETSFRSEAKNTVPPAVSGPSLTRDELVLELNRQREATKAVIQGGQAVSQKLSELGAAMSEAKETAEQNRQLREELEAANHRLDALERGTSQKPSKEQSSGLPEKMKW